MGKVKSKKAINTEKSTNIVTGCNFTGVNWDAKALDSIETVAKALLNLTELFKSQNIQINSLLAVHDGEKNIKIGGK